MIHIPFEMAPLLRGQFSKVPDLQSIGEEEHFFFRKAAGVVHPGGGGVEKVFF